MLKKLLVLQGFIALFGFVTTSFFIKSYGLDSFGKIAFIIAVSNIVATVVRYGYDETLIVLLSKSNDKWKTLLSSLTVNFVIYVSSSLLLLFYWWVTVDDFFLYFFCSISFLLIVLQIQGVFDFYNQQVIQVIMVCISKLVYLSLLYCLFQLGCDDILINFALSGFISNVLLLIVQYYFLFNKLPIKLEIKKNPIPDVIVEIKYQLRSNFPVMISSLLSLFVFSANQIVIESKLTFSDLGAFAVFWQIVNLFTIFMKQVSRVQKPKLINQYQSGAKRSVRTLVEMTIGIVVVPIISAFLLYLVFDYLIPIVFSEDLLNYKNIYLLLCIFIFVRGLHFVLNQVCYVIEKNYDVLMSYLLAAISYIAYVACYWADFSLVVATTAISFSLLVSTLFLLKNLKVFNENSTKTT